MTVPPECDIVTVRQKMRGLFFLTSIDKFEMGGGDHAY